MEREKKTIFSLLIHHRSVVISCDVRSHFRNRFYFILFVMLFCFMDGTPLEDGMQEPINWPRIFVNKRNFDRSPIAFE